MAFGALGGSLAAMEGGFARTGWHGTAWRWQAHQDLDAPRDSSKQCYLVLDCPRLSPECCNDEVTNPVTIRFRDALPDSHPAGSQAEEGAAFCARERQRASEPFGVFGVKMVIVRILRQT